MRANLTPSLVPIEPHAPVEVTLEIFNDDEVIVGYSIRVLGIDPSWVEIDQPALSLFPDTSGTATIFFSARAPMPAGIRTLTVEVTNQLDPTDVALIDLGVDQSAERLLGLMLDPMSVFGGRRGRFAVRVTNRGNTPLESRLTARDDEDHLEFAFDPPIVNISPGEQQDIWLEATGKRPLLGNDTNRTFLLTASGTDIPATATGIFVQEPYIRRRTIGFVGFLAAIAVFAAAITFGLGSIVDRSEDADELAQNMIAAQNEADENVAPVALKGTVRDRTTNKPIEAITVDIAPADKPTSPVATAATGPGGTFEVEGLRAGDYIVRFVGAGFDEQWYPGVRNLSDAEPVTLEPGGSEDLDVSIEGRRGSISGQVVGTEPDGAVVTLLLDLGSGSTAEVTTQAVGADGSFELGELASPFSYVLILSKDGFADQRREVPLGAGETVTGVELLLRRGDGSIAGTVSGRMPDGTVVPLGGARVVASAGETVVETISITSGSGEDGIGSFRIRDLPTAVTYTVTIEADDYAKEILKITLVDDEPITRDIVLRPTTGTIRGTTLDSTDGTTLGAVEVAVTGGEQTYETTTTSADGSFVLRGLPTPATYTVTFTRSGYGSVSRTVVVDTQPAILDNIRLTPSTGQVEGLVTAIDADTGAASPAGGVLVELRAGSDVFTTVSADRAADGTRDAVGRFRLDRIPPGPYTITFSRPGSEQFVRQIVVDAPETTTVDAVLRPRASIGGTVYSRNGPARTVRAGTRVRLYRTAEFPNTVLRQTTTGSNGKYLFADLEGPERYTVTFARDVNSAESGSRNVALDASEQRRDVDFEFDDTMATTTTIPPPTTTTTTTTSTPPVTEG